MIKKLLPLSVSSLFILMLWACANPPKYPREPVIEFLSISKNTLTQNSKAEADFLEVTFSFTDGDGDLGSDDSVGVFIVDGRDNFPKPPYKIPFIDPQGAGNGISGEITIRLNTTCCLFPNGFPPCSVLPNFPTDTLTYKINIRDRAGNFSNTIETPPIILLCK